MAAPTMIVLDFFMRRISFSLSRSSRAPFPPLAPCRALATRSPSRSLLPLKPPPMRSRYIDAPGPRPVAHRVFGHRYLAIRPHSVGASGNRPDGTHPSLEVRLALPSSIDMGYGLIERLRSARSIPARKATGVIWPSEASRPETLRGGGNSEENQKCPPGMQTITEAPRRNRGQEVLPGLARPDV